MKKISFILCLLSFISKALSFQLSSGDEQQVPVFQPVPTLTIDTTQLCEGGLSSAVFPFSQNKKNYVALSMSICGLYIYDITDMANPKIAFNSTLYPKGKTLGITYSNTTQYLWIAHQTGLFFGINTAIQPFNITIQGMSKGNLPVNKIIPWPVDNNVLFLMCYTMFQIFDFRNPSQGLVYLQEVNVNGLNTYQIEFIRQYTFALVTTANVGVQYFIINNGLDIDNITFTLACYLKPTFFDVSYFELIDENTIAIMMLYRGIFLFSAKAFLDGGGQVCTPTIFQPIDATPNQGLGGHMYLTHDRRYLFSQFRSVGVRLYDMKQKSFQILQNIFVDSNCNDIILNSSEDLLFYTNSLTLQIFQRTVPNFNRDVPNLLLNTYQLTYYTFFKEDPIIGNLDFECTLKENKQELFLARADYGAAVFKYSGQGILESSSFIYRQQNPYFPVSKIAFLADDNTAYLTRGGLGISIVNFADPTSPAILKEKINLHSPYVNFNYIQFFKNFQLGLVVNYINGYIISIADPMNPFIIGVIDTLKYTFGDTSFYRFALTKDENHVFMILYSFGVLTGDITNPLKPQITSQLFTDGCYDFRLTSNEKYGILAAAYQGIIIVSIQPDYSLTQVSQVKIIGSLFNIIIIQNDQYVLATTDEYPSISLVSITDILNPVVVQTIGDPSAFGYYSMCVTKDNSEVFITSNFSLLLLQIQNQIILHTQIYVLTQQQNSNQYTRNVLPKGQALQIGQHIEMHLVPIYQSQNILVRQAQYYFQNVLQSLPSWMTFQPSAQILSLSISKDSLQRNNKGEYVDTIQQVVFTTYQSILDSAFVNNYLQINTTDSFAIKKACIVVGYVDELGFVQPSYTPSQQISFGVNENVYLAKWIGPKLSLVKEFIQYILNQNIINYTTSFYITQSIQVDLQNKSQIIFSLQNDITIELQSLEILSDGSTIPTNKAKFVNKVYSSVLILISAAQDQLKLEGSLDNINSILKNGIKYSIDEKLIKPENILIQMTVSDGVNYNYVNTIPYKSMTFLSLQAPVIVSQVLNLQKDLNSKYPSGEIFIEDSFQYQISSEVFTSLDSTSLQYTAQINQGNKFVDIPKDSWVQFSPTDRVFTGTAPASQYNDHITIQVNATDGYSFSLDQFVIVPNRIPFNYAFQLAIQIFGPIFGVLGFYKYKHFIYNISFKRQYVYSKDVAYVGEIYKKQITITDDVRDQAERLWSFFHKKIGDGEILHQLSLELMRLNQVTSYDYFGPSKQKQDVEDNQESQEQSFEEEVIMKMYPFGINDEDMSIVDRKFKKIIIESSSKLNELLKSGQIQTNEKQQLNQSAIKNDTQTDKKPEKTNNDDTSSLANRADPFLQTKSNIFKKRKSAYLNITSKKAAENIKHNLGVYDKISRLQYLDNDIGKNKKNYNIKIFENGNINFVQILKFIKQQQENLHEKQRVVNKKQLQSLLNPNSILSRAICCFLIDFLIHQDKVTKNIFEFLQKKACRYYLDIDWYKAYVNINPQFEEIHSNPYPHVTINEKTYRAALVEIFRSISRHFYDPVTKNPKKIKFSESLLQEAIKARAIGFTLKSPPLLQVTQGESLHTFSHLIHSVKAFERNSDIPCCYSIHKLLDIHYIEKGLTDNEKLPSWINSIDLINGAILISGIPEKKDIGSIIVKIIDESKFIVRSFQIQVLQKQTENLTLSKPIVLSYNRNKQTSDLQPQNILSALNSQQNQQTNTSKIRQKKVSAFAPNNQSLENLSNQNFPLTDRLSCTNANNQDISIPLFSPNNQRLFEMNDQTFDLQEMKQIEISMSGFPQENEKEQEIKVKDMKQIQIQILNNNAEIAATPKNQTPQSNNHKNNQLIDNPNTLSNNQQETTQNIEKQEKVEILSDQFIPPNKIVYKQHEKPNQIDISPENFTQNEDDNQKFQSQNRNNAKPNLEKQNTGQVSQNVSLNNSLMSMFQYQ
ncbi:hypothetical protein TTHERM_00129240 (macronuclear) [Tetrahymena thermophila SB210]|uniref:Dystroglycan-type cadherin-like domain-containing protein n=1 Tax=Tetrahymena thermophila (strain SB210) TaxID=312017 RepID=I7MJB4_TETTS|nr:hypothetical protein TTHERM_00129240 [Tetrahymena thermophila SB210]EAR96151.2 hypothetical protein TTHERM_00129240 [Tetrahymena thermophila SB210]|eukprot:XP_001016396.2 hypothetical protein TTHERM_00129240 [Tetrahymena thermophila SB210]